METMPSGDKTRILPAWMTAQGTKKRVGPVKSPKKRLTSVTAPVTRRTVYCMNEAELVDVALGILNEGCRRENLSENAAAGPAIGEHSPTHLRSPCSPEGTREEEHSGEHGLSPSTAPSQRPEKSDSTRTCDQSQEEEEDDLKYVREIFFS